MDEANVHLSAIIRNADRAPDPEARPNSDERQLVALGLRLSAASSSSP